jgi:cytochrome P450
MASTKSVRVKPGWKRASTSASMVPNVVSGRSIGGLGHHSAVGYHNSCDGPAHAETSWTRGGRCRARKVEKVGTAVVSRVRRTLTRQEILTYVSVVAGAGNETTARLIGWLGSVLAHHSDQRAELVADPGLIPNAIEETLRFEPTGHATARYVTTDTDCYGTTVPAGSAMMLLVASANRDEERWPDPDRFDIHRRMANLRTFGFGTHYCLGASLARLEAKVALEEFLRRFPRWEVDRDVAALSSTSTVHGWETLPITVG